MILSAAAVAALGAGCTAMEPDSANEGGVVEVNADVAPDIISFSAVMDGQGGGATTKSRAGHLSIEDEIWAVEEEDLRAAAGAETAAVGETKAAPVTALSGYVGITAIEYKGTWDEAEVYPNTRMQNDKFAVEGSSLIPETPRAWRNIGAGDKIRFYAYAPYDDVEATLSPMDGSVKGTPYIEYDVRDDATLQTDLLYANTVGTDYTSASRGSVPLTFGHALSAVQFRIGFDCTVKSLTVHNVLTHGKFQATGVWSERSVDDDFSFTFGNDGTSKIAGDYLVTGDNTLMMIPQTFTALAEGATVNTADDPCVELKYRCTGDAEDQTIVAPLGGSEWKMGHKIVYTLHKENEEGITYIYFDLAAGNVEIKDDTYKGYVYVNGVATENSGTHSADNKYYIYQSNGTSTEAGYITYNKDNTGYKTALNEGECRIPAYPAVTCGGKNWGDYITNNTNDKTVHDNWPTCAQAAGRKSTNNYIKAQGEGHTYDITIDNIWSTYDSSDNYRKTGGVVFCMDYTCNNQKNILRLKGDNRVANIIYARQEGKSLTGYLKLTSYNGDGSSDGTLTAMPINESTIGAGSTLIGGTYGGGVSGSSVKTATFNLIFDGGTYYASAPYEGYTTSAVCCVGGSGNADGEVIINGGRITAITHSTSAAIGGGGGYVSGSGKGYVTITGGDVYAYNPGIINTEHKKVVLVSAIGGGSSYGSAGATGKVTISGGNVYAQSIGGTAIGGGSSVEQVGGNAEIKITGGNVTAVSIGGTITSGSASADVSSGNAIGGGSSDSGSKGGDATVEISGGTVNAGSIGGGKTNNSVGNIGSATIAISGSAEISGQFVMAKGSSSTPTFTMTGGTIKNSSTSDTNFHKVQTSGGAVYMEDGTCTISGGTISGCTAEKGGAIYMNGGTLTLSGGTLSENNSTSDGGAIYIDGGAVSMTGGTITRNVTGNGNGGGVCVHNGSFTMNSTAASITHNAANFGTTAGGYGGGIYIYSENTSPTVKILQGNILSNSAELYGGGISVNMPSADFGANVYIGNGTDQTPSGTPSTPLITNNSAGTSGGGLGATGSGSRIHIYTGTIRSNSVSTLAANPDISNEDGLVRLYGTTANNDVDHITVTFDANDGSFTPATASQRMVSSVDSRLFPPSEATSFSRSGYTLVGWSKTSSATSALYTVEGYDYGTTSPATFTPSDTASDFTLYAVWQ